MKIKHTEKIVEVKDNKKITIVIHYRDKEGNPADKKVATQAEILKYDNRGNVISRAYGELG